MMLADSNLIVYAASGNYPALLEWFLDNKLSASAVSLVEALGYHKLKPKEKSALEVIFSELAILYPTPEIFQTAVELRQQRAMSFGAP
jgi:toxin FitB